MKKLIKLSIILALSLNLSACKLSQPNIGVTVYPVQYLVERIAQNKVTTTLLSEGKTITRAQMISDYEDKLDSLDVLFVFGSLEPYLSVYNETLQSEGVPMVDLTSSASVYAFQRYETSYISSTRVTLESSYYLGSAFNQVDMYQNDPYLWLDPITMISIAGSIKDWLVTYYPEEKATFEANYEALALELARMDADYQELWKQQISFVSVTPSFGNWQKAFGINVYPLILSKYGVLPTETQLAIIEERIKQDEVQYIVHEPNLTEDMEALYQRVKDDLKLQSVEMHNIAFLTDTDVTNNKNYITLMWENLSILEGMLPITYAQEETTTTD